jgi:hypothetical protein
MKGGIMTAAAATVTALFRDRPLAPQVADRLAAAEARAADLTRQIAALSLDEVLGEAGVAAKRQALEKEQATATAEVERLRQAHRQATARDQRAEADAQATKLAGQMAEFERIAGVRHAAMVDVCTHLEAATVAYGRFIAGTAALMENFPEGTKRPAGSEFALGYATAEIAGEMWRHGDPGQIGAPGNTLPGAASPRFDLAHAPDRIEAAHVIVAGWNTYLVESVRAQIDVITEFATEHVEAA